MTEPETNGQDVRGERPICAVCGTVNDRGDRFCAECGAPLSGGDSLSVAAVSTPPESVAHAPAVSLTSREQESAAWLLGARPGTVIAGGVLLLLLAAALLAIGQRDTTGTIVMLSFCVAPLALLTLLIGIARLVYGVGSRKSGVGGRTAEVGGRKDAGDPSRHPDTPTP